jgi:hypothetical protein
MKTIDQIIEEVDVHKIYPEMVAFINEVRRIGDMTGDQASTYENKYHLITAKVTKLLSDVDYYVNVLDRKKDDKLGDLKAVSEEKSEAGKERDAKTKQEYRDIANDLAVGEVTLRKIINLKKWFDQGVFTCRSRQANQKKDWHTQPKSEV